MSKVFLRSPYNYDMDAATLETALACDEPSLAIQSAAEECDINTIVRRFGLTGQLPDQVAMPQSGDYAGVGDFQSAMNIVRQAEEEFMKVPADIRARFGHSPHEFSQFFENPDNYHEAVRLGLAIKRPDPVSEPTPVES